MSIFYRFRAAAFFALALAVVSCSRLGPMPTVNKDDGAAFAGAGKANLHFFFDRTESMRGFTANGDDSSFVNALPKLWNAAEETFINNGFDAHFYEYGETYTHEFKGSSDAETLKAIAALKKEILRGEFYGGNQKGAGGNRSHIKGNERQPFSAVADYVRTLSEPDTLCVIVTDLYEQNREDPFSRYFREAFSRGLSGALFAIESSFSGTIYSVSRVDGNAKGVAVRNGVATFFVCVVGDSALVAEYSAAFSKDLQANKITFNNAVFMVKQGENIKPVLVKSRPANKREFSDSKNAFASMNIDRENLKKDEPSYRLLKFDTSRWSAGLPLSNINFDNFNYNPSLHISFAGAKTNGWQSLEAVNFSARTRKGSKIPLSIAVDINNNALDSGYYKIDYGIIPEAKTAPEWVTQLNAPDIQTLEASAQESGSSGVSIKVLQLANVYEKIASAYNKINSKNIYAGILYLVKR